MLITITNILFLLLFFRIMRKDNNAFYFNPILSAPCNWTERLLVVIEPIFPTMTKRCAAAVVLLFLIVFRGALMTTMNVVPISVGSQFVFLPKSSWIGAILFSFLSFFTFLVRFWGFNLFVSLFSASTYRTRMHQAVREFASPVSSLPSYACATVLFAANLILVVMLLTFSSGSVAMTQMPVHMAVDCASSMKFAATLLGLTLYSFADLLVFTRDALVVAIFACLFAVIIQRREFANLSMEFQNIIIGWFGRKPVMLGIFNFSPILFYFAINILYFVITQLVTFGMHYAGVM